VSNGRQEPQTFACRPLGEMTLWEGKRRNEKARIMAL
jgi:hypothetical protein